MGVMLLIKWLQQPEGSSLCGQTCVAMIAGITLEESIAAFGGKRSGTRTKDLVAALRKLGIDCGDPPLARIKYQCYPDTCIVKLHFDNKTHTHWTLWHNGRYYDPDFTGQYTLNCYKGKYPEGVRATSYLPIYLE
jgi:hypothetical protein